MIIKMIHFINFSVVMIGLEFVGPGKRVMFGIIGQYFFALGEMLLGFVAYWIRSWRMLQLVLSAPVTIFCFYFWLVKQFKNISF